MKQASKTRRSRKSDPKQFPKKRLSLWSSKARENSAWKTIRTAFILRTVHITQAWGNGCIANITIVLVVLITLSHTVVRHKNALFSLRVTNMTFYLTLDKLLNSDFFVFIYTFKRFMLAFSIKLLLWFIVHRPVTHDVFCVTNKIKNVWRSDVTKAFS